MICVRNTASMPDCGPCHQTIIQRASWVLGGEERVRDQSWGARPGAFIFASVLNNVNDA